VKDLYQILGVKDSATPEEIKRAYRDHAKKLHPDKTGGDKAKETRFKDITAAHEVLSDPKKRAQYDAMKRGGFPGMPGGPGGGQGVPGGMGGFGSLEEMLASLFGGGGNFRGGGGGGGRGRGRPRGFPGVDFVEFQTGAPPHAAPPPHLEQVLRTSDGSEFLQKGNDLFIDVPLAIDEAVLGAKVQVPTLTGRVTLTIPAGTSSGKRLRLRGKGLAGEGDLYVVVQIVVPTSVDDKAREALHEFTRRAPVTPRG
jgi:DnaJ-class molecular chaperone